MVVIDGEYLVGKIVEVNYSSSRVLLAGFTLNIRCFRVQLILVSVESDAVQKVAHKRLNV